MDSDLPLDVEPRGETAPVTERILRRLGPPKWLWITLWALVALISPVVVGTTVRLSGQLFGAQDFVNLLATQGVLAYACFVLLWGGGLVGRQAAVVQQELARLAPRAAATDLFRGVGSVRGPLLLTAIVVVIASAYGWTRYGPLPPLAALPLLFVYLTPILTFVWVYLTILTDVNRLGREPLALDVFPQDRTLGLEKLGSLVSTGLGLVLVAAVPVLLASSDQPVTLGISLTIVGVAVAIFVLSMWRLHRQMAAAKTQYIAIARRLYAEAYAPIRQETSVATLEAQSSVLRAAQTLEERAHNLPSWPIDEGTLRFIAVVITGVVTSLIVRGLFAAAGF